MNVLVDNIRLITVDCQVNHDDNNNDYTMLDNSFDAIVLEFGVRISGLAVVHCLFSGLSSDIYQ